MPSNYTSLIEDLENIARQNPNTTSSGDPDDVFLVTDSPFPSPADPFEGYINGSDYKVVQVNSSNGTLDSITVFEYLNVSPWLVYGLCGVALLVVMGAIVGLIVWLKKHKTRVINETSDPVLTSNYPDGSGFFSCCCCCKSAPKMTSDHRQNSSSNLEFYGRPALPQSAYEVERPKSQESTTIATSNHAMYIDGIEDIPNRDVPQGQQRALPKHRYQQYQLQ